MIRLEGCAHTTLIASPFACESSIQKMSITIFPLQLLPTRIRKFINLATAEAHKSDMEFKHGAVLVKGGGVIAAGCNLNRTRIQGRNVPSLHAEICALKDKSRNQTKGTALLTVVWIPGSDLFLVRLSKTGLAASKPCEACLTTLRAFGVHKVFEFAVLANLEVYYSTRDGVVVEKVGKAHPYLRSFGSWKFNSRPVILPVDE